MSPNTTPSAPMLMAILAPAPAVSRGGRVLMWSGIVAEVWGCPSRFLPVGETACFAAAAVSRQPRQNPQRFSHHECCAVAGRENVHRYSLSQGRDRKSTRLN